MHVTSNAEWPAWTVFYTLKIYFHQQIEGEESDTWWDKHLLTSTEELNDVRDELNA